MTGDRPDNTEKHASSKPQPNKLAWAEKRALAERVLEGRADGSTFGQRVAKLLRTAPHVILRGASGELVPGRMTLLLGSPGAGKSVLLQALSGRLAPTRRLRISGSVEYNGVPLRELQVPRVAALVEQLDNHIGSLSVLDTCEFSARCQNSEPQRRRLVAQLRAQVPEQQARRARCVKAAAAAESGEASWRGVELATNGHAATTSAVAATNGAVATVANGSAKHPAGLPGGEQTGLAEDVDEELAGLVAELLSQHLEAAVALEASGNRGIGRCAGCRIAPTRWAGPRIVRRRSPLRSSRFTMPRLAFRVHLCCPGGERKRLTSAEVLAGPQSVMCMDEISTGLDSATAYSVLRSLCDVCHALRRTYLISLLQPQPEVVGLFDDLILLTDGGEVVYHGPVDQVLQHFERQEGLGFACPPRKDAISFLQELSTPIGQLQYATPALLADKGLGPADQDPQRMLQQPPIKLLVSAKASAGPGAARDERADMAACFWERSELGQAMMRRLAASEALGPQKGLFATIQPTLEYGRNVLAVSTLSTIFVSMLSTPQISFVFATKRATLKHRDNRLVHNEGVVLSQLVTQMPQSTFEALAFSLGAYWLAGLTPSAANYFRRAGGGVGGYLVVIWSSSNALAGLFRLVGYAARSAVTANAFAFGALLLLILSNGFSITANSLPPWIIWVYWRVDSGDQWIWGAVGMLWGLLGVYTLASIAALRLTSAPAPQPTVPDEKELEKQQRKQRQAAAAADQGGAAPSAHGSRRGLHAAAGRLASLRSASWGVLRGASLQRWHRSFRRPLTPDLGAPRPAVHSITLVCQDLHYYVPDPSKGQAPGVVRSGADKAVIGMLELLKGVSFFAEPGQLVALMGGSGAGKTTLMDIVLGRKTQGIVRGRILVNGHEKVQATWSRVCGYVEQTDVHSAGTTVREALVFSARLRLEESAVSMAQVQEMVDQMLQVVELEPQADMVVGNMAEDAQGLSSEQRKRLSIAVELVANPSVMFLDEPTSGLDARAAAIVMRAVKNVALSNRTVMVGGAGSSSTRRAGVLPVSFAPSSACRDAPAIVSTVGSPASQFLKSAGPASPPQPLQPAPARASTLCEQPSIDIFLSFDQLLLLQLGGRTTFFGVLGADSCRLVEYLSAQPGVQPLQPGHNPATWMLEVTGGSMATTYTHSAADFPALYEVSELRCANDVRMEALAQACAAAHAPLALAGRYATVYWRSPDYNAVRIIMTLVVAIVYGLTYMGEGRLKSIITIATIQNIVGLSFTLSTFLGMYNCVSVQPVVDAERVVFWRERAASMYSPFPFALGLALAEVPYLVVQAVTMVCVTYWMVGFQALAWKFFYFLLLFFLSVAMYSLFGQLLVFATPNQLMSQLVAATTNQLWTMFNGGISPSTYMMEGLSCSQLCDRNDVALVLPAGNVTSVPAFMASYFVFKESFVWPCVAIVAAYALAFLAATTALVACVSFQRR
eukprot:scaffold19.g1837.t1